MAKKEPECPAGAPLWMVTFSDLVTLLLTFFVLLLSMANMDEVKFDDAKSSIKEAFGFSNVTTTTKFKVPVLPSPPVTKFSPLPRENSLKVYKRIKTELQLSKIHKNVELVKRKDGAIILRINDSVLFAPGQATVNPSAYPLLRKIADIIRPLPMTVRIEGHTDNTPLSGAKMTNWDLSVARAVSVLRFYTRGKLFTQDRTAATGYGATHPVVPNTTPENRKKNRRVDFVLKSQSSSRTTSGKTSRIPF